MAAIIERKPTTRRKAYRKPKKVTEYFQVYARNVIVPFAEYFEDVGEEYEEFILSCSSKKLYAKISAFIVEENNLILNRNHQVAQEFIYKYMSLKCSIDLGIRYPQDDPTPMIADVISLFNNDLVQIINDYVEDRFQPMATEDSIKNKKYKPEMTFIGRHSKSIYMISCMSRLIIPVCTHYVHVYSNIDVNEFFNKTFKTLFDIINHIYNIDLYEKLYRYTENIMRAYTNKDVIIWRKLTTLGDSKLHLIDNVVNKIITTIIPKASFDKPVVKLLFSVLRANADKYITRGKMPYDIHHLSSMEGQTDSDNSFVSEAEIFDSYMKRPDSLTRAIRKHSTKTGSTIINIMQRTGSYITPEELEFYKKNLSFHGYQKTVLFQAFSRYFGGVDNIYDINKDMYIKLVIILTKMLERSDLKELSRMVTAKRHSFVHKRMSKSLEKSILEDPLYQNLITVKYKHVQGLISNKNFIKNDIATLLNNSYIYNHFGESRNGEVIKVSDEKIKNQVLQFYNIFVL